MAGTVQVTYVDTFQTRLMQSFVNMTSANPTLYPATTAIQVYPDPSTGGVNPLTAINIYDQWALRVVTS